MSISSQEVLLAAWSLLLSQIQIFLNNDIARVPIFPNQEGIIEMRDEVLSSVGADDMDTSWYEVSDLDDIFFYWENDQLDLDAVFRPGIHFPFPTTALDDFEMGGGSAENPILLDDEEDKENSPPTTPVSERQTQPPALLRTRPFGTRLESIPEYAYRNLFQFFILILLCMYFTVNYY